MGGGVKYCTLYSTAQGSIFYVENNIPPTLPFWKSNFFHTADKICGVLLFHFPFNYPIMATIFPLRSLSTKAKIMHNGTIYLPNFLVTL